MRTYRVSKSWKMNRKVKMAFFSSCPTGTAAASRCARFFCNPIFDVIIFSVVFCFLSSCRLLLCVIFPPNMTLKRLG